MTKAAPGAGIGRIAVLLIALIALSGAFAIGTVSSAVGESTVNVSIANYMFTPGTITVVIGVNNTVTWTMNQTGVPYHTVTANDNSWGSGELTTGETYTHTFTTPGTYPYHCTLHTYMMGTVIVLGAGSSSTESSAGTPSTSTTQPGNGSVPEFPFVAAGAAVVTVLIVASYLLAVRRRGVLVP